MGWDKLLEFFRIAGAKPSKPLSEPDGKAAKAVKAVHKPPRTPKARKG